MSVGDIIITSSWVNDDWLYGECNGQEGMFPLQFVKILQELPKDLTTVSGMVYAAFATLYWYTLKNSETPLGQNFLGK